MGKRAGKAGNWPKALQKARKESEKQGWTWTYGGNGHWVVRDQAGDFVISMGSTIYDGPLVTKLLSRLRKAGCPGA